MTWYPIYINTSSICEDLWKVNDHFILNALFESICTCSLCKYLYEANGSLNSTLLLLRTLLSWVAFLSGLRELLFFGLVCLRPLFFEDPTPSSTCCPSVREIKILSVELTHSFLVFFPQAYNDFNNIMQWPTPAADCPAGLLLGPIHGRFHENCCSWTCFQMVFYVPQLQRVHASQTHVVWRWKSIGLWDCRPPAGWMCSNHCPPFSFEGLIICIYIIYRGESNGWVRKLPCCFWCVLLCSGAYNPFTGFR